jgi:hypothetical protein
LESCEASDYVSAFRECFNLTVTFDESGVVLTEDGEGTLMQHGKNALLNFKTRMPETFYGHKIRKSCFLFHEIAAAKDLVSMLVDGTTSQEMMSPVCPMGDAWRGMPGMPPLETSGTPVAQELRGDVLFFDSDLKKVQGSKTYILIMIQL